MSASSASSPAAELSHSAAQEYTFGVPSPPRVVVPPMNFAEGTPGRDILPDASLQLDELPYPVQQTYDFASSGFSNTEFLKTVTYNNFLRTNPLLEWKYEDRRVAQQILPFLYLGPSSAVRDRNFLVQEGITMCLAVRNTLSAQARLLSSKLAEQELGIETHAIDVAGNQELIAAFPHGIQLINSHLTRIYQGQPVSSNAVLQQPRPGASMGKVLVFCESGNERSASLVVAYIMAMYSKNLVNAIQIVQAQRFAVAFDDSLRNLLFTYESILKARRDVHGVDDDHDTHDLNPQSNVANLDSDYNANTLSSNTAYGLDRAKSASPFPVSPGRPPKRAFADLNESETNVSTSNPQHFSQFTGPGDNSCDNSYGLDMELDPTAPEGRAMRFDFPPDDGRSLFDRPPHMRGMGGGEEGRMGQAPFNDR